MQIVDNYIEKLMTSKPNEPLWNIEQIRQGKEAHWNYIDGCMMNSLIQLYEVTNDKKYLNFVKTYVDYYLSDNGNKILGYNKENYSTDDVAESRILFDLYKYFGEEKYKNAIELSYSQILTHPRTKEGSFWHKKIYPNQVWLDGLYMMQVFYMRYETIFNGYKNYKDIKLQYQNVRKNMFNSKKGLHYHAYDASRESFWCDKETGLSKNFWLRACGWHLVSLVDILGYMDEQIYEDYAYYKGLLKEAVDGILKYLDKDSNMFYQVIDKGSKEGNYLETSGSAMVAYTLLKGARLRVLPERYAEIGLKIFDGICNKYLTNKSGDLNLGGICLVAGLGPENNRRRDGTFKYYISEPIVENDAKGVGPFIMAYTEVVRIRK